MTPAILRVELEHLWADLESLGATVHRRRWLDDRQAQAVLAAEKERLRVLLSPEALIWAAWTAPDRMRAVA